MSQNSKGFGLQWLFLGLISMFDGAEAGCRCAVVSQAMRKQALHCNLRGHESLGLKKFHKLCHRHEEAVQTYVVPLLGKGHSSHLPREPARPLSSFYGTYPVIVNDVFKCNIIKNANIVSCFITAVEKLHVCYRLAL